MRGLILSAAILIALSVSNVSVAGAEDPSAGTGASRLAVSSTVAYGLSLGTPPAAIIPTEDPMRTKLEEQVRRNRRALIGTSVGTAVGLSFWMVASARGCAGGFSQRTDRLCTKSGNAVRTTGIVLFSGGLAGMLISGTMLSVRKRQLEDLGSLVHRRKPKVRWDAARSRFVF